MQLYHTQRMEDQSIKHPYFKDTGTFFDDTRTPPRLNEWPAPFRRLHEIARQYRETEAARLHGYAGATDTAGIDGVIATVGQKSLASYNAMPGMQLFASTGIVEEDTFGNQIASWDLRRLAERLFAGSRYAHKEVTNEAADQEPDFDSYRIVPANNSNPIIRQGVKLATLAVSKQAGQFNSPNHGLQIILNADQPIGINIWYNSPKIADVPGEELVKPWHLDQYFDLTSKGKYASFDSIESLEQGVLQAVQRFSNTSADK